jgi:hypothetical protein
MRHTYYPSHGLGSMWRLPHRLPGRRLLAALWAWM